MVKKARESCITHTSGSSADCDFTLTAGGEDGAAAGVTGERK